MECRNKTDAVLAVRFKFQHTPLDSQKHKYLYRKYDTKPVICKMGFHVVVGCTHKMQEETKKTTK